MCNSFTSTTKVFDKTDEGAPGFTVQTLDVEDNGLGFGARGFTTDEGHVHATVYAHGVTAVEASETTHSDGTKSVSLRLDGGKVPTTFSFFGVGLDDLAEAVAKAQAERSPATVKVDGQEYPLRLHDGNHVAKAVVLVNDVAVGFGTTERAADAAAQVSRYEPVFVWSNALQGYDYAGVAGDLLDD